MNGRCTPHKQKQSHCTCNSARVCVVCLNLKPPKNIDIKPVIFSKLTSACCAEYVCTVLFCMHVARHILRHIPRSMLRDMFRATCTYSAQHALVNFEKIYPDTARIAHNMLMNAKSLNKKKRGLQDLLFYPNHWGHTRSGLQMVYGSHLPRTWLSIKGP